jgi:hypothetical protein
VVVDPVDGKVGDSRRGGGGGVVLLVVIVTPPLKVTPPLTVWAELYAVRNNARIDKTFLTDSPTK